MKPTGVLLLGMMAGLFANGIAADSITSVSERLENLESLVLRQKLLLESLSLNLNTQTSELTSLKERASILDQRVNNKTNDSNHPGNSFRGQRAVPRTNVAFSAFLDNKLTHVQIGQVLQFDRYLINDGRGFDTASGVFIAPVTGVYVFTYEVNTFVRNNQLVVQLVMDGVNESDSISDPKHSLQEVQGGNTIFLRVRAGQQLYLKAYNTGNTAVDGRDSYRFSTFSGCLLYT